MTQDVRSALDAVYRSDWGRIVAALIRLFGYFDAAEEAAQEPFAAAVARATGVPTMTYFWRLNSMSDTTNRASAAPKNMIRSVHPSAAFVMTA